MPIRPNDGGSGYDGGSPAGGSPGPAPSAVGGGSGPGSGAPVVTLTQRNRGMSMGVYNIVRTVADRAESGPSVVVGPGDVVTVTPLPTNTQNCFFSIFGATSAKSGPSIVLMASANPRTLRVRNLNEIWVYSAVVGEGVYIDHQRS